MTQTLVQLLRARLNEDERTALAATQGDWVWSREFVTPPGYHHRTIGPLEPGDAAYIATWAPARVLREIAVDRELLREYEQLLRAHAQHKTAAAELAADIEHENKTGKWEGVGDPGTRRRALQREADYLPAMLHVMEKWAKGKAATYTAREGDRQP